MKSWGRGGQAPYEKWEGGCPLLARYEKWGGGGVDMKRGGRGFVHFRLNMKSEGGCPLQAQYDKWGGGVSTSGSI